MTLFQYWFAITIYKCIDFMFCLEKVHILFGTCFNLWRNTQEKSCVECSSVKYYNVMIFTEGAYYCLVYILGVSLSNHNSAKKSVSHLYCIHLSRCVQKLHSSFKQCKVNWNTKTTLFYTVFAISMHKCIEFMLCHKPIHALTIWNILK